MRFVRFDKPKMASSEFPKAMKAAPNGVTQMESLAAPPASDEGYLQFTSSESEANTPLGVDPNMGFPQTDSGCENLDFLLHVDPALLDITQLGGVDFLMPDPSGSYPDVRATNVSMPEVPDLDIGATPVSLEPSSKGTKWTGEMETFFLERKRNGDTYVVIVSKMRDKFGVSLNPNILSKRFKSIAKLVSKNAVSKAL